MVCVVDFLCYKKYIDNQKPMAPPRSPPPSWTRHPAPSGTLQTNGTSRGSAKQGLGPVGEAWLLRPDEQPRGMQ